MDEDNIPYDAFAACLKDLAKVNVLTLAARPTMSWLTRAFATRPDRKISILDIGSGGGDMLRRIRRWGNRNGLALDLTGIDLNPWSQRYAETVTPAADAIRYVTGDVFAWQPDRPVDLIISSLVTHHMDNDALLHFLGWMHATARRGWLVNDLHRHPLAWHGIRLTTRLLRLDPMVAHDGPISVARAFSRGDWVDLLQAARVEAEIRPFFPFRFAVGHLNPGGWP